MAPKIIQFFGKLFWRQPGFDIIAKPQYDLSKLFQVGKQLKKTYGSILISVSAKAQHHNIPTVLKDQLILGN